MLNYQLDPPLRDVTPSTLQELLMYQDLGYNFRPGVSPTDGGYSKRRQWNDASAVSMPFESRHPITVFPRVDWNTGHRVFQEKGYYDVELVVGVAQDAEVVYYQTHIRKACMLLDVSDSDMESEGSEYVKDFDVADYDGDM